MKHALESLPVSSHTNCMLLFSTGTGQVFASYAIGVAITVTAAPPKTQVTPPHMMNMLLKLITILLIPQASLKGTI